MAWKTRIEFARMGETTIVYVDYSFNENQVYVDAHATQR